MKQLDRKKINRMVDQQGNNSGGGGAYTAPTTTDVPWANVTGKPTTIGGYGITDAYWASQQTTSDKRNLTIGSVTQQVITAHQSLSGYATEQWVLNKNYLTSVSWSDISNKPSTFPPSAHTHPWSEVTNKPVSKTAWGQTFWNSSGDPVSISGAMSSVTNIDSILYFDTSNNRIGIGTSSPSYALHVSGTIYATGGVTGLSDIRKKNVITYEWAPCLSSIAEAPIIRYTMKDDEKKRERVGSVAQYWQKVMPEAVTADDEGTLSMNYGEISLVNVIALAREVKHLKEEINRLKEQQR